MLQWPYNMIAEIFLVFTVALLTKFYLSFTKPPNFPPGPSIYAILGSLLSLISRRPIQETLLFLSKVHGPYVGLKLGKRWTVAVNGYEAVKEVLSRDDCALRPDNVILTMRSFDKKLGILFADGALWKAHRRFAVRHLRTFGFGKSSTQERMLRDEADALLASLRRRLSVTDGAELQDLFPISVINVLWAMMAGEKHDHEDTEFKMLLHNISEYTRQGNPIIMMFPWLRFVPVANSSLKKLMRSSNILQNYIKNVAEKHMATYVEGVPRDFIDVFIEGIKKEKDPTFNLEQLIVICMDLFLGGTDTTSNALSFTFLYLAVYPQVQQKLRDELELISPGQEPALSDSQEFHYFHAVVHEVLRHSCMVPLTPPHAIKSNIILGGYKLTEGTSFLINLYSVLMDKEHWGDPEVFRPERFLSDNGTFVKDPYSMSFGHGPRLCLGEPLARDTLFIFVTSMLCKFKFSLPKNQPTPTLEPQQGLVLSPQPYRVVITQVEDSS